MHKVTKALPSVCVFNMSFELVAWACRCVCVCFCVGWSCFLVWYQSVCTVIVGGIRHIK